MESGISRRIERARNENLFIWDYKFVNSKIEFNVQGSKGTLYKIQFNESGESSCNCPDIFSLCKHKMLIMLNIFKIEEDLFYCVDDNFLKSVCFRIKEFKNQMIQNFKIIENGKDEISSTVKIENKLKPRNIDEQCFICFEPFKEFHKYFTCKTCNNAIHLVCWETWKKKKSECPLCRSFIK